MPRPSGASYLAFDLGASSGRGILGTLADGQVQLEELHRFETPIIEEDGHLYWDVDALWKEMNTAFRMALDAAPDLRSLSVDSWGVDYVPLNVFDEAVRRPYAYRDPRTVGMLDYALQYTSKRRIYRETGIQFMEINTIYQVLADARREPVFFGRTRNRLTMADYFNYRFSGKPVVEMSLASTTQLMRAGERSWSTTLIDALNLGPETWPDIVPSGTPVGPVQGHGNILVVAGCSHDTACAVAATPADEGDDAWAYISCGTWSLLGVEIDEPLTTDAAMEAGFTNEAGLDGTIRFLKNLTGLWILQECEREWREQGEAFTYEELIAEAEAASSPEQYIDVNHSSFALRGDMQEKIGSYCREHDIPEPQTRGELVRLIIESLAEGHRVTLAELEELRDTKIETIHMVGGGSQNELLCQLTADRCGCTVVAGPAEATALGNILVQARALADLPPDVSIRDVVRNSVSLATYHPR